MEKEKVITVMKRYELKYELNKEQLEFFMEKVLEHMKVDKYGLTSIASLYYDTPNYYLINRSIEKPKYKEKIRLRSYGLANENSKLYLEIKRKLDGIVYKRRIPILNKEMDEFINHDGELDNSQISREIMAFKENYGVLEPKYLIIYDRIALYQDDSDLRITIDKNPRYRVKDLNLTTSLDGEPLLDKDSAILEVKVQHSVPLWLVEILTKGKIYQTSFSKVGTAHKKEYLRKQKNQISIKNSIELERKGEYNYGFTI